MCLLEHIIWAWHCDVIDCCGHVTLAWSQRTNINCHCTTWYNWHILTLAIFQHTNISQIASLVNEYRRLWIASIVMFVFLIGNRNTHCSSQFALGGLQARICWQSNDAVIVRSYYCRHRTLGPLHQRQTQSEGLARWAAHCLSKINSVRAWQSAIIIRMDMLAAKMQSFTV